MSENDAQNYCYSLVENGYDDWRLPSIRELFYINDPKNRILSLISNFKSGYYWSSTKNQNARINSGSLLYSTPAYYTLVLTNRQIDQESTSFRGNNNLKVLCVRGEPLQEPKFIRKESGIVYDEVNQLEWQDNYNDNNHKVKNEWGVVSSLYCKNLSLGGKGWRLPTPYEISTTFNYDKKTPILNSIFTNNDFSNYYFSSIKDYSSTRIYLLYDPRNGKFYTHKCQPGEDIQQNIRCVRDTGSKKSSQNGEELMGSAQ